MPRTTLIRRWATAASLGGTVQLDQLISLSAAIKPCLAAHTKAKVQPSVPYKQGFHSGLLQGYCL
ncbi:hypothetical protein P4S72_14635 [Vibrio sp. PP-XX7]